MEPPGAGKAGAPSLPPRYLASAEVCDHVLKATLATWGRVGSGISVSSPAFQALIPLGQISKTAETSACVELTAADRMLGEV